MNTLKWNVHVWTGKSLEYVGVIKASSENSAKNLASIRSGYPHKDVKIYPHLDNMPEVK